jgi:hypothetical protein
LQKVRDDHNGQYTPIDHLLQPLVLFIGDKDFRSACVFGNFLINSVVVRMLAFLVSDGEYALDLCDVLLIVRLTNSLGCVVYAIGAGSGGDHLEK